MNISERSSLHLLEIISNHIITKKMGTFKRRAVLTNKDYTFL